MAGSSYHNRHPLNNPMYQLLVKLLADYLVIVFIPVFFYFWLYKREKALALRIVLAVLITSFLARIIKGFYYIPRPFVINGIEPIARGVIDSTFPSSHAADSFAFAGAVFFKHKKLGYYLLVIAGLVSLGRVLGLVHRPIDITAGAILGLIVAWSVVKLDLARKL